MNDAGFSLVGSTFSTIQRTRSLSIPVFIELTNCFLFHQRDVIVCFFQFPTSCLISTVVCFVSDGLLDSTRTQNSKSFRCLPIRIASYQGQTEAKATSRQILNLSLNPWQNRFLGTCRARPWRALDLTLINQKLILHFFHLQVTAPEVGKVDWFRFFISEQIIDDLSQWRSD